MANNEFVYVTMIKAKPERVWEALTESKFLEKFWFGSSFETDWQVGSKIKEIHANGAPGFEGEVLVSDPPKKLSYTFVAPGEPKTVVTYFIEGSGDLTSLKIVHEGFDPESKAFKSTSVGWAAIASSLKSFLESSEPLDQESIFELFGTLTGESACGDG